MPLPNFLLFFPLVRPSARLSIAIVVVVAAVIAPRLLLRRACRGLGWVGFVGVGWGGMGCSQTEGMPEELQPRFVHNLSGRFESRWSTVKVRCDGRLVPAGKKTTRSSILVGATVVASPSGSHHVVAARKENRSAVCTWKRWGLRSSLRSSLHSILRSSSLRSSLHSSLRSSLAPAYHYTSACT